MRAELAGKVAGKQKENVICFSVRHLSHDDHVYEVMKVVLGAHEQAPQSVALSRFMKPLRPPFHIFHFQDFGFVRHRDCANRARDWVAHPQTLKILSQDSSCHAISSPWDEGLKPEAPIPTSLKLRRTRGR